MFAFSGQLLIQRTVIQSVDNYLFSGQLFNQWTVTYSVDSYSVDSYSFSGQLLQVFSTERGREASYGVMYPFILNGHYNCEYFINFLHF